MSFKFSFLLLVTLIYFGYATSDSSQDVQECANSLVGLSTCLPYVGGTAKSPTPDCCSGLKQVLKTSKKCLCVIIKDRNDPNLGLNINVSLALGLPDACNAPANISQCPALLNLPPNSPDAQVFYKLKPNSTNTGGAASPAAAPTNVTPDPTTSPPAGANASSRGSRAQQQSNGGCTSVKRRLMLYILRMCKLIGGAVHVSALHWRNCEISEAGLLQWAEAGPENQ